ncbi:hypothetical protein [Sorangium sp. So ce887]|uniref:hypothetical protein n=1 Tax=Sorangium sp. So ce887 TaxID=3133324 RepID=UPI003F5F7CB5
MSLFRKRVLPLTLLGAAAVLGGCVGEASLEGDDGQEIQPDAAEAADPESAESIDAEAAEAVETAQQAVRVKTTTWGCEHRVFSGDRVVRIDLLAPVTIWWGHTEVDARWACNQWIWDCRGGHCNSVSYHGEGSVEW